jgi:hypothetical protein
MSPLFMCQGLCGRATCAFELASKYAEVRFIVAIIITRGWIMHARQFASKYAEVRQFVTIVEIYFAECPGFDTPSVH